MNQESLGVAAFNDSILLEASVYNIIDRHFAKLDCYPFLLREFHNVSTLLFACGYQPAAGLVVAFHLQLHLHHQMSKVYYTSPAKFGGGGRDTFPLPRQTLTGEVGTLVHLSTTESTYY